MEPREEGTTSWSKTSVEKLGAAALRDDRRVSPCGPESMDDILLPPRPHNLTTETPPINIQHHKNLQSKFSKKKIKEEQEEHEINLSISGAAFWQNPDQESRKNSIVFHDTRSTHYNMEKPEEEL